MSTKNKDYIGVQTKEKGRKRVIKSLLKSSEALDDKNDAFKCKKRPWSEEEDQLVIKLVHEHGPQKWTFIATHLEGRIGKQCRERWHNHLNPQIKKCSWSEDEEWVLYLFHKGIGNKWAEIAKYIVGRTDNSIKNHWNSGMKKRLDDYGRKLANVREVFEEVGESYFNRITLAGEKKALEILLLNKQYVPSDCDEDMEDDEEEEEMSQDENINTINNSTMHIGRTNNTTVTANPTKEMSNKEELDNSQKTKEKLSVNSKSNVNPFTWSKVEDDHFDKNATTIKKSLPVPQVLKHSQSLQSNSHNTAYSIDHSAQTPKGTSTYLSNSNYSSILKENRNELNKIRGDKKVGRQVSPSLKEDPKKKIKMEEHSPTLDSEADKKKKNNAKKENSHSQLTNSSNCEQQGTKSVAVNESKKDDKKIMKENKQVNPKDSYYNYYEEGSQQIPHSQYPSHQSTAEDKEYNRQMYEGTQPHYGAGYPGSYHPYPLQRSQSYNGYAHPLPHSSHPSMYPVMYPPNHQHSQSGNHQSYGGNGHYFNPNQQYKYDPHYYPHYQPMNYMYYPYTPSNPSSSTTPPPYPYYKDYQYPKAAGPAGQTQPQAINGTQPNYNAQSNSQNYNGQQNTHQTQQQSTQETQNMQQQPNLMKSQSVPMSYAANEQNITSDLSINQKKVKTEHSAEEQSQRKREDTKSSSYSQQMTQPSSSATTNENKGFLDLNYMQQDQNKYMSTLNSDFKYKQLDCSPFQIKNRSPISESLDGSSAVKGDLLLESNQKDFKNIYNHPFPHNNTNLSILHPHFGMNYESPSKMLNLSERVMLKTVSSAKQYFNNMNSNIKYPVQRQTIHPLNLNSLFSQEDDFFNDSQQNNNN